MNDMYLSQIIKSLKNKDALKAYAIFEDWKSNIVMEVTIDDHLRKEIEEHKAITEENIPPRYPSLAVNGKLLYNLAGFENLKIALTKWSDSQD